jgi:hypothetical protein
MIYVYCMLISWASIVAAFVGVLLLARWAIPRYGAKAMQMALARQMTPPATYVTVTGSSPPLTPKNQ